MEQWKPIKNFPRYEISNYGRVKSLKGKEKILTPYINKGYCDISLSNDGQRKHFLIHSLVWSHFSDIPQGDLQIDHRDENKINNHIDNLQLLTCKENINKHWDYFKMKWLFE